MHEEEEQRLVNSLNFDLELWPAVFILIGITMIRFFYHANELKLSEDEFLSSARVHYSYAKAFLISWIFALFFQASFSLL